MLTPVIRQVGDSALLVELGEGLDLEINRAVQRFDRIVNRDPIDGVLDTSPTLRSLLVRFDPLVIPHDKLKEFLLDRLQSVYQLANDQATRRWRVPVYYGGDNAAELEEVASLSGLTVNQVINEHCEFIHTVLTLGFAPGFLYLGLLPSHWHIPRLQKVKPQVPAGSVSVAVGQTVVTSTPIPTGWRTIGITPYSNFVPDSHEPFRVVAGDEVQFSAVDAVVFDEMSKAVAGGERVIEQVEV